MTKRTPVVPKVPKSKLVLPAPTCRSCSKPLVRVVRARHRVWYECTNLRCEKNQKKGHHVGSTRVL